MFLSRKSLVLGWNRFQTFLATVKNIPFCWKTPYLNGHGLPENFDISNFILWIYHVRRFLLGVFFRSVEVSTVKVQIAPGWKSEAKTWWVFKGVNWFVERKRWWFGSTFLEPGFGGCGRISHLREMLCHFKRLGVGDLTPLQSGLMLRWVAPLTYLRLSAALFRMQIVTAPSKACRPRDFWQQFWTHWDLYFIAFLH